MYILINCTCTQTSKCLKLHQVNILILESLLRVSVSGWKDVSSGWNAYHSIIWICFHVPRYHIKTCLSHMHTYNLHVLIGESKMEENPQSSMPWYMVYSRTYRIPCLKQIANSELTPEFPFVISMQTMVCAHSSHWSSPFSIPAVFSG